MPAWGKKGPDWKAVGSGTTVTPTPETPPAAPAGVLTLHFVQADLTTMRNRRTSGPFHTANNGAPWGDWTRIVAYKDAFMAAPLSTRWAGPTGNNPGGVVRNASDPGNNLNNTASGSTYRPPDKEGGYLRDAAFFAWIIGSGAQSVAQQAATSLVAQVNYQDTVFGDRTRWSTGTADQSDTAPWWVIAVWLIKQIYAYDFLTAFEAEHSVSLFTAAQRTAFQAWVESFCEVAIVTDNNNYDSSVYSNRSTYATTSDAASTPSHSRPRYQDNSGAATRPEKLSIKYNNRSGRLAMCVGLAGVRWANATNKAVGVRWVKEALRFGIYPDGSVSDFERAEANVAEPTKGWKYSCEMVGMMNLMAHSLWVYSADAQLFTHSTTGGLNATTDGVTAKTLKSATLGLLRHVSDHYVRWIGNGTKVNDDRIKPGGPASDASAKRRYNDIEVAPIMDHYLVVTGDADANTFRDLYMRYAANTNPQPQPPVDGQGDVEGGPSGVWPASLFCFGRT